MRNNIKKTFIIIYFSLLPGTLYSGVDEEFSRFIKGYSSLKSIKGSINQYIYNGPSVEKFSGDYSAVAEGMFRIDYLSPERQIVISNTSALYWYYPGRELLFVRYYDTDKNDKISTAPWISLSRSFSGVKVNYEGIRFYALLKYAHVYSFSSGSEGSSVRIWFEPEKRYVVRKYIVDNSGFEIMKEIYHKHINTNGIYIPSVVELFARSESGIIHTLTEYGDLIINTPVDKSLFDFRITKDMTVRRLNEVNN